MASVSLTHMVLFIASLLVAASVAGVLTDEVGRLSDAITEQGLDASKEVRTDIEIISDAGAEGIYDTSTDNVTVHVKNTGSERLEGAPREVDVILDGEYQTDVFVEVVDGDSWDTNNVARIRINEPDLENGQTDHRLKVIVNGDEEVFEFTT